jgi:sugar (pentulose or hexulose) kinase
LSVFYRVAQILELIEEAFGQATQIIMSGGVLHSPESVRLLDDAVGRDLEIAREPEASLRGAAFHALEQLGRTVTPLRQGEIVRHHSALAAKHRARRNRQIALEKLLSNRSAQ